MAPETTTRHERLGLSVAWGYVFGPLLMLFVFVVLVPDADGPSPWDGVAFRSGILEMAANFRILDELVDLGIVQAADVGSGILKVDLDLVAVSDRKFGSAALWLSIALVFLSLLLRSIRQRVLCGYAGLPADVRGQMSSYFYGRGMNLFFPFGPGDSGVVRALVRSGGSEQAATVAVSHGRVLELVGIIVVLVPGLLYLGWGGAVGTLLWTTVLVTAVVSLTRPLGWRESGRPHSNPLRHVWEAFGGTALRQALGELMAAPSRLLALLALSVVALLLEVGAYWFIKQAFSSPMDDYVLMKDIPVIPFTVVGVVAALTRIIPYTFASFGVYEIVAILMFRIFGEGYLSATTVALLESLLLNTATLVLFVASVQANRTPSILETWREFFEASTERARQSPETLS